MLSALSLVAALAGAPAIPLPDAATPIVTVQAGGVQVYKCVSYPLVAPAWTLDHPAATLYKDDGTPFGTHGAGPMWAAADGSTIYADGKTPLARVVKSDGIPWLLLRVTSGSGSGTLVGTRYVERFDTLGGNPPDAADCDKSTIGTLRAVHYSAKYEFFR